MVILASIPTLLQNALELFETIGTELWNFISSKPELEVVLWGIPISIVVGFLLSLAFERGRKDG